MLAKILIIDDEVDLREGVKSALEMNNYKVFSAESGVEGVQLAKEVLPDLILCDIMMPDKDGYWVLDMVRRQKELSTVPFIFVTAKVERGDLRKGMDLGADDYLTKPFKIYELLKSVEVRLEKSAANKSRIDGAQIKAEKIENDKLVFLDTGKSIEPFHINSIECILADNVYTQVYIANKKFITVRKSLAEWEKILPENIFVRIHRGTIINLNFIKSIEKWFNQTMIIHLQNYDKPVTMSRSYSAKLKEKLIIN